MNAPISLDPALVTLIEGLAAALGIGLLVGIERGWKQRERKSGDRTGGIRTYALMGLTGGIAGALVAPTGPWVLAAVILLAGGAFAVFKFREQEEDGTHSVTGVIAAIATLLLGALAVLGPQQAAAMTAIAMTLVLAMRDSLHRWLTRLTWEELRSGLLLLTMTVIALPFVPDRSYDPWGAVNPREVWLFTILIAGLSAVGYYAIKIAGPRWGPLFAGAAGGLVSSTAVTLAFSRLANEEPGAGRSLAMGASLAGAISVVRPAVVVLVLAPSMFPVLGPVLVPAALAFLLTVGAAALMHRGGQGGLPGAYQPKNPFDLLSVFQFAALLAVVLLVSRALTDAVGGNALLPVAVITGLADIDAVTLSAAKLSQDGLSRDLAGLAVVLAVFANLMVKLGMGLLWGGRSFRAILGAGTGAACLVGAAAAFWTLDPS